MKLNLQQSWDMTSPPGPKCDPSTGDLCNDSVSNASWGGAELSTLEGLQPLLNATLGDTNATNERAGTGDEDPHWVKYYEWRDFRSELSWALSIHVYGFACVFFMLSFYTFFSILNLRSQLSTRPFMSTINVFVCVLGVSRATSFLIGPYHSQKVLPGFLGWVLWDVGYPCILSAFGLIQLAFTQITQMTFRPESLRKKSSLSLIIALHFICVLASNVVAALEHQLVVARVVVQVAFLIWGIILCLTFLYGGGRILSLLKTLPNSAFQNSEPVGEHKGILQLALLAQCNNIASSVITAAAAPSILAPKIKITDENEMSISAGSEGTKAGTSPISKVPEINITVAESPTVSEPSPKEKDAPVTQPLVKIEICDATPETPGEEKLMKEIAQSSLEEPAKNGSRRKKSLTWIDESKDSPGDPIPDMASPGTSKGYAGATLGCDISGERKRRRGSSDTSSRRSSTTSVCSSRRSSASYDGTGRKGSHCYYPEVPSRKGSHVGEALVLSRRGSLCSEISSRRSSSHTLAPGTSSRRGSHRSMRDEAEVETLLRRPSDAGDVTLSSILNHIAYVNQANASKVGVKVKESRKEQVKQVLIVTYVTAILGMALSLLLVVGLYAHPPPSSPIPPWVWFAYENACRLLEFLIGCAMANITRQPVNRPTQYGHSIRLKSRNSIYM